MAQWMIRLAVSLIRAYQLVLAPWSGGACRFDPSCSNYAMDAIRGHGARRGLWLSLKRVARCHPLGAAGFDPAPPPQVTPNVRPTVFR
jgi:putative membrane protein insertion efficiency factor